MRILFHDAATALAYDAETMRSRGLGGTESTLVRVAEGLSAAHEVAVVQRGRREAASPHRGLQYVPLGHRDPFGGSPPDWVIVLRKHRYVPQLRARYPSAAMVSWIQNWQRVETVLLRAGLARSGCEVIAVSEAHREATDRLINGAAARAFGMLRGGGGGDRIPVRRIFNAMDDRLAPDGTPVDRNKLVYFSNKGIRQVLAAFAAVHRSMPFLRLHVAGPSRESVERHGALARQPGLNFLGRLPQHEVFPHVREALCVFYPQNVHAETFGLVYAESNALGTPVLAHDFGAAREVLGGGEQLVDGGDPEAILAKLRAWHAGARPKVAPRPEFRVSSVLEQWRRLLESPRRAGR
jgi:glycosyltransferase involved in cell wall biosynthesis